MPVSGRKPSNGPVRHRVKPTYDWTEVADVLFTNGPDLPDGEHWSARARTWWKSVSSMPHCATWTTADWQFAIDTAYLYEEFVKNASKVAPALLAREKLLGTTADFRRDLRIRYVAPDETDEAVTEIDDYRERVARLTNQAAAS